MTQTTIHTHNIDNDTITVVAKDGHYRVSCTCSAGSKGAETEREAIKIADLHAMEEHVFKS